MKDAWNFEAAGGGKNLMDSSSTRAQRANDVYEAFRRSGFSDNQARALTAQINRENSLRPDIMFGTHTDPANKALNVGILSWQGSRAPKALEFLRERGVLDEQGRMIPGQAALQAQTDFIRQEMEQQPEYRRTRKLFLENPNVDPETAAVVLGDNYIRWRRTDPEYSGSGNRAIAEGYRLLGESNTTPEARRAQYGLGDRDPGTTAQVLRAVQSGAMTMDEAGRFVSEDLLEGIEGGSAYDLLQDRRADEAQGMAMLGKGLQMLNTPQNEAPTLRALPMRLSPGRPSATPGTQAIGRFGLEGLLGGNPLLGIR